MKISKIISKINARIESIQSEDKSNYPDDYKQHLSVEEAVYRKIKIELEFSSLSSTERQAKRIIYLAICRKANTSCHNELKMINMYDAIVTSVPYIKALNHNDKLLLLEELCSKEADIIDDNSLGHIHQHVTQVEIENAFKPYFEKIYPFKMDIYKECYQKIEDLYEEFKKLQVLD